MDFIDRCRQLRDLPQYEDVVALVECIFRSSPLSSKIQSLLRHPAHYEERWVQSVLSDPYYQLMIVFFSLGVHLVGVDMFVEGIMTTFSAIDTLSLMGGSESFTSLPGDRILEPSQLENAAAMIGEVDTLLDRKLQIELGPRDDNAVLSIEQNAVADLLRNGLIGTQTSPKRIKLEVEPIRIVAQFCQAEVLTQDWDHIINPLCDKLGGRKQNFERETVESGIFVLYYAPHLPQERCLLVETRSNTWFPALVAHVLMGITVSVERCSEPVILGEGPIRIVVRSSERDRITLTESDSSHHAGISYGSVESSKV